MVRNLKMELRNSKDNELRKKTGINGYQFMEQFFEKIDGETHAAQFLRWLKKLK